MGEVIIFGSFIGDGGYLVSPVSILLDSLNGFIEVLLWFSAFTLVITFCVLLWWKLIIFTLRMYVLVSYCGLWSFRVGLIVLAF